MVKQYRFQDPEWDSLFEENEFELVQYTEKKQIITVDDDKLRPSIFHYQSKLYPGVRIIFRRIGDELIPIDKNSTPKSVKFTLEQLLVQYAFDS